MKAHSDLSGTKILTMVFKKNLNIDREGVLCMSTGKSYHARWLHRNLRSPRSSDTVYRGHQLHYKGAALVTRLHVTAKSF